LAVTAAAVVAVASVCAIACVCNTRGKASFLQIGGSETKKNSFKIAGVPCTPTSRVSFPPSISSLRCQVVVMKNVAMSQHHQT
jgi:hypothetical protein